jgi:hypothetical protein
MKHFVIAGCIMDDTIWDRLVFKYSIINRDMLKAAISNDDRHELEIFQTISQREQIHLIGIKILEVEDVLPIIDVHMDYSISDYHRNDFYSVAKIESVECSIYIFTGA